MGDDPADHARDRYVVKYRRQSEHDPNLRAASAAMCVSEAVAASACRLMEFPTPEPSLVYASSEFVGSYGMSLGYLVLEGYHFGTIELPDAETYIPSDISRFSDPLQWVTLWAIDSWLMNTDRKDTVTRKDKFGNVLVVPARAGKWQVVAVDHSDCFRGAGLLVGGRSLADMKEPCHVDYPSHFERVMLERDGIEALRKALAGIRAASAFAREMVECVPEQWWTEARVNPEDMEQCLTSRASMIEDICELKKWEAVPDATRGGRLFTDL